MLPSSPGATDRQMIADIIRYQAIERHRGSNFFELVAATAITLGFQWLNESCWAVAG